MSSVMLTNGVYFVTPEDTSTDLGALLSNFNTLEAVLTLVSGDGADVTVQLSITFTS